jgi:ribonuclease BN (tRNA processing enzyme)
MELTIVGCSGSVSGPDSPASSYLVQAPHQGRTFSLVVDLGPGAFGALYRYLDPSEVDAIALSHLHPDHCLDLCAFYVGAKYSAGAPWAGVPLYSPSGAGARLAAAYDVAGPDGEESEPGPGIAHFFDYRAWQPEQRIGPFDVRVARVEHPVEAYALRIEQRDGDGGSMVFSGDTGPCDALVELATGVDLLLAEAAFRHRPTNPPGLHLSGRQAAEAGAAAGVGKLVLTHIPPWNDPEATLAEARPYSRAPVTLARAGARWTVP